MTHSNTEVCKVEAKCLGIRDGLGMRRRPDVEDLGEAGVDGGKKGAIGERSSASI